MKCVNLSANPVQVFERLGVRRSSLPPAEAQRRNDVSHFPHLLQQGLLHLLCSFLWSWNKRRQWFYFSLELKDLKIHRYWLQQIWRNPNLMIILRNYSPSKHFYPPTHFLLIMWDWVTEATGQVIPSSSSWGDPWLSQERSNPSMSSGSSSNGTHLEKLHSEAPRNMPEPPHFNLNDDPSTSLRLSKTKGTMRATQEPQGALSSTSRSTQWEFVNVV